MNKIRRRLVPVLEWALVAACVVNLARFLSIAQILDSTTPGGRWLGLVERRFEGPKQILPPFGVVGYVTDRPIRHDDTALSRGFYTAQYALCPRILVEIGASRSPSDILWIVGDYERRPEGPLPGRLIQDFGDGLVLLQKEEP